MSEETFQLTRLVGFVTAFVLAIGLERVRPHSGARASWTVNGGIWATNVLLVGLVCAACATTAARWSEATAFGVFHRFDASVVLAIPITVVVLDLLAYLWHRANHAVPLLWRFHQLHHSDASFTASTALRFHPGEILAGLPLRLAGVTLLGAPVEGVLVFELVFTLANLLEHGDVQVPEALEHRIDRWVVTPALHRRHHSREGHDLGTNFGTILIVWDRVLGTYGTSRSADRYTIGLRNVVAPGLVGEALRLPLAPLR